MFDGAIDDWSTVKKRWAAWWECGIFDRAMLQVTAPRADVEPGDLSVDSVTRWTNFDHAIKVAEEAIRTTHYMAEAIPRCWNPISAGHALYFGGCPRFHEDTMWVERAPNGLDGFPVLDGWQNSPWWRWACAGVESFARASRGRFMVLPFWGNHAADILAVVRGVDTFYMDFVEHPEWIQRALRDMSTVIAEVHEELWKRAYAPISGTEGSMDYGGCWSPRRALAFDSDVSCNVSDRAFRETILPPMRESMQAFDHILYHLDGPGALHHLDTLLGLPEIDAIQWVPGAGHEEIAQWYPLIQRIQRAGKGVQLHVRPQEVAPTLDTLRPEGLLLSVRCATYGEASRLIDGVGARF
ncbi:MAG: hypothetical protein ACYC4R_05465 [Anaerolineae bacterium]